MIPGVTSDLDLSQLMIPKLIHQVCLTSGLPESLRSNVNRLKDENPAWLYQLYDDTDVEDFIQTHYGFRTLAAYQAIDASYAAARADFFRYLAVYQLGGVYLDLKSRFAAPIDTVIKPTDAYIISQWRNGPGDAHARWGCHPEVASVAGGEFQQWHVIGAAGHPFLAHVIDAVLAGIARYKARTTTVGWEGVVRLTGPIVYTRAIAPLLASFPHRRIANETVVALEYSVLEGLNHQSLFKRHYSQNERPLVKRGWPLGTIDHAILWAGRSKRALREWHLGRRRGG